MRISMIRSRLEKINTALPGLLLGIIVFGILCQVIGLFLVDDKADYSIGLWVGVVTAIFMALHMAFSLNSIVERDEKGAQAAATRTNIIRYLVVVIVLGVLMITRIGNPLAAFIGVMGLKVSAYIQPVLLRRLHPERFSQAEADKNEN
jgi:cobalamin synthase